MTLRARPGRDLGLEAHAQSDRFAHSFIERRREAARLEQNELAVAAPGRVEQGERNARRLAGARRRDQHEIGALDERGVELWQNVVDRQAIGKGADQAGLREKGPLQMRDRAAPWQDARRVGRGSI